MKLKEFQAKINKLVKQGHGDKEVFYSSDEEGNVKEYNDGVKIIEYCWQGAEYAHIIREGV